MSDTLKLFENMQNNLKEEKDTTLEKLLQICDKINKDFADFEPKFTARKDGDNYTVYDSTEEFSHSEFETEEYPYKDVFEALENEIKKAFGEDSYIDWYDSVVMIPYLASLDESAIINAKDLGPVVKESVDNDTIGAALDAGKTITLDREGYTPAKFNIKDGKVMFHSKEITDGFGDWLPHPTMDKQALLNHCAMLQRQGFTVTIDEELTEAEEDEELEQTEEPTDRAQEIINEYKERNPLYERVVSEIVEDSEDYNGETLKEKVLGRLEDISHGLSSGVVGSLIYYSDTVAFFNEYEDEIYDMVEEWDEQGLEPFEMLKRNCSAADIIMGSDNSKNWIVWAVYEEIAYQLESDLESE